MHWIVVLIGLCVSLASVASGDEIYRFGPLGKRLTTSDLAAISRAAAADNRNPWAVFGSYSQILPETWYVDAFLPPTRSTNKVRVGEVRHLECKPTRSGTCLEWRVVPKSGRYVQVADGQGFDESVKVRRSSERPIQAEGEFSDPELVSLILFVRSKPAPKSGGSVMGVTGTYPIISIHRQINLTVWVRMSEDGRVGETAIVRKTTSGWQVMEVGWWVA